MPRKPDIFDEIILFLRESPAAAQGADLPDELRNEFFSDRQPADPPQTVRTAPRMTEPEPARPESVPSPAPEPAVSVQTAAGSPDTQSMDWESLRAAAFSCRACGLCETRNHVVFGEGPENARLMFIGEGPGADEDAQGRPFVGRAGELLTKMIAAMGFRRAEEVYIANVVKCRPPQNRTPLPDEAAACIGFLKRQIALIRPDVIVTLGATPLLHLFNRKGITRLRGQWLEYEGIKVMPTYHPAYLLRDPNKKIDVWQDLQLVMKEFGKTPPARKR